MKPKTVVAVLIIAISFAFNPPNYSKQSKTSGVWYCIDIDNTYIELHMNDSLLIMCNDAVFGCGETYSYKTNNDTLLVFERNQLVNTIPYKNDNLDTISFYFNDYYHVFERISDVDNYFLINYYDEISIDLFLYEFKIRSQSIMKK